MMKLNIFNALLVLGLLCFVQVIAGNGDNSVAATVSGAFVVPTNAVLSTEDVRKQIMRPTNDFFKITERQLVQTAAQLSRFHILTFLWRFARDSLVQEADLLSITRAWIEAAADAMEHIEPANKFNGNGIQKFYVYVSQKLVNPDMLIEVIFLTWKDFLPTIEAEPEAPIDKKVFYKSFVESWSKHVGKPLELEKVDGEEGPNDKDWDEDEE